MVLGLMVLAAAMTLGQLVIAMIGAAALCVVVWLLGSRGQGQRERW